ncbi:MAG: copper resistance system multicopper oxidase [Rhodospirillaceae bacterium]|jgi:CopA family copper-resistance protein|nr:copper resistance system multicopper oxidase [Rhodospirillaceae bacterium]MBT5190839.1 copper resistance system multicopper oxidase [Rhodospirillaceae bacterium]MBT5897605.1 copper resistance system multicopper oxidase [Rhodospirillaceae bacterium]
MRKTICAAFLAAIVSSTATAGTYNLTVDNVVIDTGNFKKQGIGYNGASPGPVLRFDEGEDVTINVTNNLDVMTSIHWHGLILPYQQDGVPTISYDGIKPGETFTYRFPIKQSGTYWFHSHSGFQEPDGAYGAIVIKPKGREPFRYDREYVVQLTDSHPHAGDRIMRNLKTMPDYYNRQQQTLGDFLDDINKNGFDATLADRMAWGDMRMMAADIEDLQGFTPLINGKGPAQNWTGIFKPGERIRLRFINSSAMTYFDIRIPGLKMLVVNADGNNVQPIKVDEFRIAVAETYDVIVRPRKDRAFTIFAASMGRSAFGRGTLAPRMNVAGDTPDLAEPPLLTMADMGMAHEGMDHGAMAGMNHSKMKMPGQSQGDGKGEAMKMDHSKMKGMDHSKMAGMNAAKTDPFYASGSGLMPTAAGGGKFLSYKDLKAQRPLYKLRKATREIELRLTGNMERYIWSINGKKYQDDEEIRLRYGERVRFKFVNETMMSHPMHLHGMWTILDNGSGKWNPIKHVVSVAPGTTVYTETEVDAPGQWAFHCHLSYHARAGMFRRVVVEGGPKTADATASQSLNE